MESLVTSRFISFFKKTVDIYRSLNPQKVLFLWGSLLLAILCFGSALVVFNTRFVIEIPARGGTLYEGLLGTPRFINPVLALSSLDKDLTTLVYAGLTKRDPSGNYVADLAESIVQSDDTLHYTITLKSWAKFHDGEKVTADDIMYTISMVQNPHIKSPHFLEWEGVSVEKISDTELQISLKQPYPLFMEVLSLGILPKHLWKNLSEEQFSLSDYNIHPVGAGPFSIKTIDTISGIPVRFTLASHKYYTLGRPYLDTLVLNTYDTEKALITAYNKGDIGRMYGLAPEDLSLVDRLDRTTILTSRLPRIFSIFLNANKAEFLTDKNVRKALSLVIDRDEIINTVYKGYATPITSPFPFDTTIGTSSEATTTDSLIQAQALIAQSKYFKNASSTPSITITTTNSPELRAIAELIKQKWETLGVKTQVLVYEPSDINQSVIKERDFQALLYGSLVAHPSDLYAFFHSSQRTYPGLNISGYASSKLDILLEDLRESTSSEEALSTYGDIKEEFNEETPGIFVYSPALIYLTKDKAETPIPVSILDSSGRFTLIEQWYINKEKVWKGTYYKSLITKLENILH